MYTHTHTHTEREREREREALMNAHPPFPPRLMAHRVISSFGAQTHRRDECTKHCCDIYKNREKTPELIDKMMYISTDTHVRIYVCVPQASCPTMNAGAKYEYRWADGVRIKKPIECSAPKYVDYLFQWVEIQVDNPELFPQTPGAVYTPQFRSVAKTILRRLFRVYAHIYHCHFREVCRLGAEAHLNTCFKHFVYFVQEFKLIDSSELAPLQEIISGL